MKQLTGNISYCGILNPNLRVFDIIMRTDFGTSYNSYVVKGSQATAIVDGAHARFEGLYRQELEEALGGTRPDYLIVNHTEPDHSGAVAALLDAWPEMVIVTNAVAAKNLRQITNRGDLPLRIVKDGEHLSLGDKTLRFLVAPFLHWPDTMMTWLEEDQTLFSCDVFGCHYCEPGALDTHIAWPGDYEAAFRYYYDCIFGPFASFMQKGLQKLEGLDIERICPSHGPVLTRGCRLEPALENYRVWSLPQINSQFTVPVFYCSAYGCTRQIAQAIRDGILEARPRALCELHDLVDCDMAAMGVLLNSCDAFLLGSPTINRGAVPPLWALLAHADAVNTPQRPCALFGSYGWSGEACGQLAQRLEQLKCKIFEEPLKVNFVPSEDELANARAFGKRFGESL